MSAIRSLFSVFRSSHTRRPFLLICLMNALFGQDPGLYGMILPSVGRELGGGAAHLVPYIYSGSLLALAGFLIPAGRACDLFGPKAAGMAGAMLCGLGALLASAAPNLELVIAGRVLSGLGMALLWPASLALASAVAVDETQRKQGFTLIHIVQVLFTVAGGMLGGLLTTLVGWRAAPLIGLGMAGLTIALTPILLAGLPEFARKKVRLNLLDGALLTLGVTCLLWATSTMIRAKAFTQESALAGLASLVLLALFHLLNRRSPSAILPYSIFHHRNVLGASVTAALATAFTGSTLLVGVVYLQRVAQLSAQATSILIIPRGVAALVGGLLAGAVLSRFSGRATATIGMLIMLLGAVILLQLTPELAFIVLISSLTAMAIGDMLTNPGLLAETMVELPPELRGTGSALFMMLLVFAGATITTTMLVVLESGGNGTQITPQSLYLTTLLIASMPVLALAANLTLVKPLSKAGASGH